MPVDPNSHVPLYEQIIEHVRGSVAAGVYRPDESLPSIRVMAREFLVNPNTVQRAYQELERQGLVRTRKGLGVFVAKDGSGSAQDRSERTIRARLSEAVDIGRRAGIPADRIRAIFEKVLEDAAKMSNRTEPATGETACDARDKS